MRLYAIFCMLLIVICLFFAGCEPLAPKPSEPITDSVVIRQVGDFITDVWVLRGQEPVFNVYCYYWHFTDAAGNKIRVDKIGVKVIETNLEADSETYHEYHMEHERVPYRYLYNFNEARC